MAYKPMLAEPLETKNLDHFFESDDWALEAKLDGHRVMFVITDGHPEPLNRHGDRFQKSVNPKVLEELTGDHFGKGIWVFDGEYMDSGHYYVFDLIEIPSGSITSGTSFKSRRQLLEALFNAWETFFIHLVPCLFTEHGKRDLYNKIEAAGGEGVMWKRVDGVYSPGLRSTAWCKTKLWKSVDCVIMETWREGKRSVGVGLYDEAGVLVDVGSCTMSERNLALVQPGTVIEIKYLYAGAGGRLFQPAFLKIRIDKKAEECLMNQLRHVNKTVL